MKKKFLLFLLFLIISIGIFYLQCGRDPEIINSITNSSYNYSEEHIAVNLNKIFPGNYNKTAEAIVLRYRENKFTNFVFSHDIHKPNALYCDVYLNQNDFNNSKILFSFSYSYDGENIYNIIDDPQYFSLEIENSSSEF